MQNIRSLCTNSNLGKRRSIQHLTSQWAATTVLKHASRKPSSFPNFETSTSDFSFQTPHPEKQITENLPRFFRRGVVRSCFVMVEEYTTIAERFLTTPRRKNRVVSTQNALESLLLLQPWYDHMLLRHIRLQVYQEPLSDRLIKGIWRWHAKDDIYKTF